MRRNLYKIYWLPLIRSSNSPSHRGSTSFAQIWIYSSEGHSLTSVVQLVVHICRRRLKCEKLPDDGQWMTDKRPQLPKWLQKLTWHLARRAKYSVDHENEVKVRRNMPTNIADKYPPWSLASLSIVIQSYLSHKYGCITIINWPNHKTLK